VSPALSVCMIQSLGTVVHNHISHMRMLFRPMVNIVQTGVHVNKRKPKKSTRIRHGAHSLFYNMHRTAHIL
jgi:hypothetical protein